MMKKKLIYSFLVFVAFAVLYFLVFAGNKSSEIPDTVGNAIVIRPMKLKRGDLNISVSATGSVTPINVIEIKSKASGIVEKIPIEASDPVRVGQLIAKLDQTDTRNAFEQALADSQLAAAVLIQQENNWKRAQDLFAKTLLSQQDYDQTFVTYVGSKSSLIKAQANLLLARQKLAETIVLSPINGLVLSRNVSAGQIVSSAVSNAGGGTAIARIANMDEVYVIAAVDEVDIGSVQIGLTAHIIADAYPRETFTGKVIRVAAQSTVLQNVTTFDVVILVPNKANKLKAGMNTTITIDIAGRDNVLLISNELLRTKNDVENDLRVLKSAGIIMPERLRDQDTNSTGRGKSKQKKSSAGEASGAASQLKFAVVQEGSELRLRPVHIGLSNFDESEVLSGLSDSTKVVLVQFSQARQESERFKERLKERSGGIGR
ncbi:efflux RND transporter periplasmic adaptor subunit [bacterium]|nr:efflux RND transporter periplasmic adaptor subunit [bacterium]